MGRWESRTPLSCPDFWCYTSRPNATRVCGECRAFIDAVSLHFYKRRYADMWCPMFVVSVLSMRHNMLCRGDNGYARLATAFSIGRPSSPSGQTYHYSLCYGCVLYEVARVLSIYSLTWTYFLVCQLLVPPDRTRSLNLITGALPSSFEQREPSQRPEQQFPPPISPAAPLPGLHQPHPVSSGPSAAPLHPPHWAG